MVWHTTPPTINKIIISAFLVTSIFSTALCESKWNWEIKAQHISTIQFGPRVTDETGKETSSDVRMKNQYLLKTIDPNISKMTLSVRDTSSEEECGSRAECQRKRKQDCRKCHDSSSSSLDLCTFLIDLHNEIEMQNENGVNEQGSVDEYSLTLKRSKKLYSNFEFEKNIESSFCVGFQAMLSMGDKLTFGSMEQVSSVGAGVLIHHNLESILPKEETIQLDVYVMYDSGETDTIMTTSMRQLGGVERRFGGPARFPTVTKIVFRSKFAIRYAQFLNVISRLPSSPNWGQVFDPNPSHFRISRVSGRYHIVFIPFNERFLKEF